MRIPERYDLTLRVGRCLGLDDFDQKQLRCGSAHVALWIILPLALDWHRWPAYMVIAALMWYTWVDFIRFVVFKSVWCYRCRKRKIVRWEMPPKGSAVEGRWMCVRCSEDYNPTLMRIEKSRKDIRALLGMKWLFRGGRSPSGPLPDAPPVSESEGSEDLCK